MSSLSKLVLAAVAVFSVAGASAHAVPASSHFKAQPVIASHETAPSLSSVAQHVTHRHHHRKHHRVVRHVR